MSGSGAYFMPFYTIFLKLTLHLLIDFAAIFAESDASENQEDEDPAQREEHSRRAYTWFFRAQVYGNLVDSSQYSTIKALLDSRKGRQEECLAVAETITYTCSELSGTEQRIISVHGFKALYVEIDKWGVLAATVDADEPYHQVEGNRV